MKYASKFDQHKWTYQMTPIKFGGTAWLRTYHYDTKKLSNDVSGSSVIQGAELSDILSIFHSTKNNNNQPNSPKAKITKLAQEQKVRV